jgi:hypothetical protein
LYEVDNYVDKDKPAYEDYDYDYSYDNSGKAEVPVDLPLEEDAIEVEEEEEEVEMNIDEGFLNEFSNEPVELPELNTRCIVVEPIINGSSKFIFILIGGLDADGSAIKLIEILNTGLDNSSLTLTMYPLPLALTQGGECYSAFTERSITSCGGGVVSLSPYGYQYRPGSCYAYNLQAQRWEARGGRMTSFRKGASVTRLSRSDHCRITQTYTYMYIYTAGI